MSEEDFLYRWLSTHYAELQDNAELRKAHSKGLMKISLRNATLGIISAAIFIILYMISGSDLGLTDTSDYLLVLLMGIITFLCGIFALLSLRYCLLAGSNASFADITEGRGAIPLELISRLKNEYDNAQRKAHMQ